MDPSRRSQGVHAKRGPRINSGAPLEVGDCGGLHRRDDDGLAKSRRADFSEELGHLIAELLTLGFQGLGG